VNWRHFQAFVWLRWRLLVNRARRAGALNAILIIVLTVAAIATAVPLFVGGYMAGLFFIPQASPAHLMYAWDVLIVAFVFFWLIGLVSELQRNEPLSLSKFMHLPVSVNGAFLINYLSSLLRLSLINFVPLMVAFCLALIWTKGIVMLPTLAALVAFLVMVTGLTYQFQGWLASLMNNPRRRRGVIVATTMTFVLIAQLPNLINFLGPWNARKFAEQNSKLAEELNKLTQRAQTEKVNPDELVRRIEEAKKQHAAASAEANRNSLASLERTARLVNTVLPIGWLPLGVAAAAEGSVWPSLLGMLGMGAIGSASLYRAYRTTLAMYQGVSSTQPRKKVRVETKPNLDRERSNSLLETRIPGFSEPVSAVALAALRSLIRSPEAKMMLLSPIIMIPVFGSLLWNGRNGVPVAARPLIAIGGMGLILFGLMQLMGNLFGFDRDGFRVFVLSSASRRDILLGKNLAFVPIAVVFSLGVLAIAQFACPMRLDHLLAMVPQYIAMFLLFCVFTNLLSILTPLHIAAGSLKPSNPSVKTVFIQMAMFLFLFPLTEAPTLLPLGIEAGLRFWGKGNGVPIYLLLSLVQVALAALIYYFSLIWLGSLLQSREQKILEQVIGTGAGG
jgi:hypothetical protein